MSSKSQPDSIVVEAAEEPPARPDQQPEHTDEVHSEGEWGQQAPRGRWWTRNPLRVKLVALVLAAVALALTGTGVSSVLALNRYLVDRADTQLQDIARTTNLNVLNADAGTRLLLPSDYFVCAQKANGDWGFVADPHIGNSDLPALDTSDTALAQRLNEPFTATAQDGKYRWRILVTKVANTPVIFGLNLVKDDSAIDRLVAAEILIGLAVLLTLAVAGAWMVRMSLLPLAAIEKTAAAIAGGDLTQRVPELDPRTELGQLSAALNTMLTQIESAFRARAASERAARTSEARAVSSEERMRQFVADASHELRTPLTTIRGFAELYRQGAAPEPGEVLRRIEDEAARMGLLVEDLLLLARLDRERPLRILPVNLAGLLADAAAAAHAVDPERQIELDTHEGTELVVAGDEDRLRQIIGNLVTNALVHTPAGTPVALRLKPDGEGFALIEVSDRGPGMAPEQAEHVFERFYRVDKARTRQAASPASDGTSPHSGAGLGLAIVAALVAAHDGSVSLETAPGQGATFRVRLPLDNPSTDTVES